MKVGDVNRSGVSKVFEATLETLYAMLKFIKDEALASGFSNTIVSKIELAAEEALVNIISHGYPKNKGEIEINCSKPEKEGIRITLVDSGLAFNPLDAIQNFTPTGSGNLVEETETQVGGYGIYFIVNMMDTVNYERAEDKNRLTLEKFLSGKNP